MPQKFFLSHYNRDRDIAEILSDMLRRISLREIDTWFSSDSSATGGFQPGDIWFNEILSKIQSSKAVVALLTPNSISRPWIYFESGIGLAMENCSVIPVCVGIKRDTVAAPLGAYQCFQLADYPSLKEFTAKLLQKFGVHFDEELSKPILERTVSRLSNLTFTGPNEANPPPLKDLVTDLKSHIDKRFIDLIMDLGRKGIYDQTGEQYPDATEPIYTITVEIDLPDYTGEQFIEVRPSDTVADIYDSIFFTISDFVAPFTYMENWVLTNKEDDVKLIIREVSSMIPATCVFKPEIKWTVVQLDRPYRGTDSKMKHLR